MTDRPDALPVRFDGERLEVGSAIPTPDRTFELACRHGVTDATLSLAYDGTGAIACIVADGLGTAHRAALSRWQDQAELEELRPPRELRVASSTATLRFTDHFGEPDPEHPVPRWYGVAVDLLGGVAPSTRDWDDLFPASACDECSEDPERSGRFGMCIAYDGQLNGIFIEAPAERLPRPRNSEMRIDRSGVWPD